MLQNFRLALCQFAGGADKLANLHKAQAMIQRAASEQAQVVVLPECFNSPYSTAKFSEYAETVAMSADTSPTVAALREWAMKYQVYLIGGSIPERDQGKLFNTCLSFSPEGALIGKHRKVHLFDINVPGKVTFYESDVLTAGSQATHVATPFTKIGLGICYDVRFAEYACALARSEEVGIIVYPGNFNMTTGPKHWELLLRARATDNLVYVAACSQASDETAGYVSWGHSMVVDPWGAVQRSLKGEEDVLVQDIDFEVLREARNSLWVRKHKKPEVYD